MTIRPDKALLVLKELDHKLEIPLNKQDFQKENNKIIIEYLLESQEKSLKIEIEMSDL